MAFSLDSKVKDILKNPEASAVLDKYSPDASKNPQMKLVGGLTFGNWHLSRSRHF